jgi:hypothetical protein
LFSILYISIWTGVSVIEPKLNLKKFWKFDSETTFNSSDFENGDPLRRESILNEEAAYFVVSTICPILLMMLSSPFSLESIFFPVIF